MTYCLAIKLTSGLVFAADTRTNAGVDRVASYRKLYSFGNSTTHAITLLCSGNLATTQALVEMIGRSGALQHDGLFQDSSLFDTARRVGNILVGLIAEAQSRPGNQGIDFGANLILGGQIAGEEPRLYHIYPQGNFIETSIETPFMQIGEEKYGKPILDRAITPETSIERALICALLSLDSTMKSNLTVDMPLDVLVYHRDSFNLTHTRRIEREDQDFNEMRRYWGDGLRRMIDGMKPFNI